MNEYVSKVILCHYGLDSKPHLAHDKGTFDTHLLI